MSHWNQLALCERGPDRLQRVPVSETPRGTLYEVKSVPVEVLTAHNLLEDDRTDGAVLS